VFVAGILLAAGASGPAPARDEALRTLLHRGRFPVAASRVDGAAPVALVCG
jgi:hypothetical protein